MKYSRIVCLLCFFLCFYVSAAPKIITKKVEFNDNEEVEVSIKNYTEENEPVCDLVLKSNDIEYKRYIFSSCGNLVISKENDDVVRLNIVDGWGNYQKIIFINSNINILGMLQFSNDELKTEILENNIKIDTKNINKDDLKLINMLLDDK